MPKAKLTDLAIPHLPIGMHWDTLLPAFGVRVQKTRRTFLLIHSGGRRQRIGHYPALKLGRARELARKAMATPTGAPQAYSEVLDAYIERHLKRNCRPKNAKELERVLRKHFIASSSVDFPVPVFPTIYTCDSRSSALMPKHLLAVLIARDMFDIRMYNAGPTRGSHAEDVLRSCHF